MNMISIHSMYIPIICNQNEKFKLIKGKYAGLLNCLSKQYQFSSDCEAVSLEIDNSVHCIITYCLVIIIHY